MELRSQIFNDKYTEWIYDAYDIQNKNEVITTIPDFTIPTDNWNIGLIYGNSGSGKTSLLKSYNDLTEYYFDNSKTLISNFEHLSPQEACRVLASVGLASVPSWLKPFNVLSNGEKFRAEIAMKISKTNGICYIDEFTSVVDRDVAKAISVAVSKWVRRENRQVVFASCHNDIIEWLQPDWIYSTETFEYEKKNSTKDRLSNYRFFVQNMKRGTYLKNITI
jgi:ABC-type lipoprotein export system ATPase subunit